MSEKSCLTSPSAIVHVNGTANLTNLGTLPTETVCLIADFLEVGDIGSLRLSSRSLASKVSGGNYRNYFLRKTIRFKIGSLTTLNEILHPGGLACLLQHASIAGFAADDISNQSLMEDLLVRAFIALKQYGGLRSLGLGDPDNSREQFITEKSKCSFKATMAALQKSGLLVHRLNLKEILIPIQWIRELQDPSRLASSLRNIRTLYVRLTTVLESSEELLDPRAPDRIRESLTAVARFIELMPSLEDLQLIWWKTESIRATELFFFESCFKSIASSTLRLCNLGGIYVTEIALWAFLQQTSARTIILQEIHLRNGTLTSSLNVLTRKTKSFARFELCDLFEKEKLAFFIVPGDPAFSSPWRELGPSRIVRTGVDVTQKLEYTFATGPVQDNGGLGRWRKRREERFGRLVAYFP